MVAITERDETGRIHRTEISQNKTIQHEIAPVSHSKTSATRVQIRDFIRKVFLPAGYPHSVSRDYLRYQILNALQAFCNSLASLLSSRATLEGFGVGNPSASATNAMLLTVLQDMFGRLTTIFAAYLIGSSLYPEAKTYRLLADILNDAAVVLDTFSPLLNTPFLPGLRVGALCLSASLRALCSIAAGGSKAAITIHFASPSEGTGDVGDLNAKDASKETVLALLGMLLGTLIVPRLTTLWSTYSALFLLVGLHIGINYLGVRGLVLRSLNRQRTGHAWMTFRSTGNTKVPLPRDIARTERIFERPGVFRNSKTGHIIGQCEIGSSIASITQGPAPVPLQIISLYEREKYLLWYDFRCLQATESDSSTASLNGIPRLHICLKDGYSIHDQLKAWANAGELCQSLTDTPSGGDTATAAVQSAYKTTAKLFSDFIEKMRVSGWNTVDGSLMTGSPKAVVTTIEVGATVQGEEKKKR